MLTGPTCVSIVKTLPINMAKINFSQFRSKYSAQPQPDLKPQPAPPAAAASRSTVDSSSNATQHPGPRPSALSPTERNSKGYKAITTRIHPDVFFDVQQRLLEDSHRLGRRLYMSDLITELLAEWLSTPGSES